MASEPTTIRLRDWTKTPGGRYRDHGKWSGEEFVEDVLFPALAQRPVILDLDGVAGHPTGWLEEVFGGIVRKFCGPVSDRLTVLSQDLEIFNEAMAYMVDAEERHRRSELCDGE